MPRQPKETDLPRLKSLAHTLLMLDIQPTKMSPIVVKHPFTDSGIVGIQDENGGFAAANLLDDPGALQRWTALLHQQIDEMEKPFELLLMVTKSYKLAFLKYAAPDLSKQDLALFLSHSWITTESPNSDPNLSQKKLLSMFRSADPKQLMDEEEYTLFQELDDVVTVYRGVTSYNAQNVKALSWTLNRDTAEWFAHRYGEDGTVYEAKIAKEHIYAVFMGRNESEVIVDPAHLMELSQVQEPQEEFEMKIARRCSIALADKADEGMMHKAFPHAVQLPELLSDCSAAIDFDRSVFSVKEGGRWFGMALQVAATAADWCYERLGGIPPEERMITFYLRMIVEWRRPTVSPSCTPCVPSLRPRKG